MSDCLVPYVGADACRLVVNIYKHGQGKSLKDLKEKYPEYLERGPVKKFRSRDLLDYTDFKLTDEDFEVFSDAIVAFWPDVPGKIMNS